MPSSVVHTYIGLDTLDKLNNKPKDIISKHIDNYKIYCQNVDPLYFYHIFLLFENKIQKLGHRVHNEKTYDLFSLLINDNKENKDYELFTFISGLITHYKADSLMHPYINYRALKKKDKQVFNDHFAIETYLDNYFIDNRMHIDYRKYNNTKFIFNYHEEEIIKKEIDKIFKELFNYPNMGKKYYRSLKEMRFVFNYIRHDPYKIKKRLYQIIDLNPFHIQRTKYLSYNFNLCDEDYYLNTNHDNWYNLDNPEIKSNKSFMDLYQDVINESSYIINELYEYIYENKKTDLYKLINNYSYSNGLLLKPKQRD